MRRNQAYAEVRRPFFKRAAVSLLCVLVLFYLGFHAISGERGVVALFKETRKLEQLKAELAEVNAEHDALEKKVKGLSSDSLDLDLLDEQARLVLGMAGKNEVVYFLNEQAQ